MQNSTSGNNHYRQKTSTVCSNNSSDRVNLKMLTIHISNQYSTKSKQKVVQTGSLTRCLYSKKASVGSSRVQQLVQYLSSVQVWAVVACINSLCCVCSVQTSPLPSKQSTLRGQRTSARPSACQQTTLLVASCRTLGSQH